MNLYADCSWNDAKQTVEHFCFEKTGKYLTDIEVLVLKGSWNGKNLRRNRRPCKLHWGLFK